MNIFFTLFGIDLELRLKRDDNYEYIHNGWKCTCKCFVAFTLNYFIQCGRGDHIIYRQLLA
jgi:hypothetical protein